MYHYSLVQWLLFFYFYCFAGWCFESSYVSIKSKRLVNRGFMRGPFLPLYGSGGIMMLVVSMPFQDNLFLVYLAGCFGATVLEYVTGVTMEALFKVRYWDYSNQKFQFQGHICLSSSLAWGFLTILMTEVVHRPIESVVLLIPDNLAQGLAFLLTVVIAADFTMAFKAAMDLRDILVGLEKAQKEMELMKKRLDVIIAVTVDEQRQFKEGLEKKQDELSAEIERRFDMFFDSVKNGTAEYMDDVRDEINELRLRFHMIREKSMQPGGILDVYKQKVIRNNPSMRSDHFKESFERLKKNAYDKMSVSEWELQSSSSRAANDDHERSS